MATSAGSVPVARVASSLRSEERTTLTVSSPLFVTTIRDEKQSTGASGVPPPHTPAVHVSPSTQSVPLKQGPPSLAGCASQMPANSLQTPTLQKLSSEEQSRGTPPAHVPAAHSSPTVQKRPSLQGTVLNVVKHPVTGSQASLVHRLPSLHTSGVPNAHSPLWQVSLPLQMLPSLHEVPLMSGTFAQPVAGSQVSVVQGLESLQTGGAPSVHTPLWQVSLPLQRSPSGQSVPFNTGGFSQPKTGSQESLVHTLASSQSSGVPSTQTAVWHSSTPLQTLPSPQAVPSGRIGFEHTPAEQTSTVQRLPSTQSAATWQGRQPGMKVWLQPVTGSQVSTLQPLSSSQLIAVPAVQTPLRQLSLPLHTLPSRQPVPFSTGVLLHPNMALQTSVVHTLLSSQLSGVPALHTPLWQVSLPSQTSPLPQDVPLSTETF